MIADVARAARAACAEYGDDYDEQPESGSGLHSHDPGLPSRRDWRDITRAALLAYHRSRTYTPEEVEAVKRAMYEHWPSQAPALHKSDVERLARAALAASDAWRAQELERMNTP